MEKKKINKKSFKKPIAGIFLVCFLLSLFSFPPFSQAASQIDISAYVVSKDDAPLSGQYSIRFALYTQNRTNSSEGETTGKVWEETQRITIKDGMIKATLGSQTSFPSNLNLTQNQYFLGIKIGENSEMVPRKKISASPFSISAISASSLNGAVAGTEAGDIPLIGTGGKIDIGLLPTGEEDNQLVLGNDPRLSDTASLSVSGSPKYLTVSGETITLKKVTLGTDTSGSLALTQGGTGLSSYTAGDMLYYSSGGALSKITIGENGQLLTIQNGAPIWLDASTGTSYTASGSLLQLVGSAFSVKTGTLTDTRICTYSTLDGLVCDTEPSGVAYSAGNDLDLTGATFNLESQLDYVTTISRDSSDLTLQTTTSGNIIFSPFGNVGVGTTSPGTKLHVSGVITATGGTSTNWNTAYSWGSHAGLYDTTGTAATAVSTHESSYNHLNYNTAYSWGNHGAAGYLTSYAETDPIFSAWDKSTGISITESQISDLQSYLTAETDPVFSASDAFGIDSTDITNWDNKVSSQWGTFGSNISYSSGNVGIGTTSPGYKLDVQGGYVNASSGLCIGGSCIDSWSAGGVGQTYLAGSGLTLNTDTFKLGGTISENTNLNLYSSANYDLRFYNSNSGSEMLFLDSSAGYVGIGTTAPGTNLEINGQIKITGGTPGLNKVLTSDANGLATWETSGASGADTALSNLAAVAINTSLLPATDDTIDLGDDTHRFRDLYLGPATLHIGSGTTDEYTLSYDTDNNRLGFNVNGSGNEEIVFNSSGYVGIGTTNPTYKLDVQGAGAAGQINAAAGLCINGDCKTSWADSGIGSDLWTQSGSDISYIAGNVGIGTASPANLLEISGGSNQFKVTNSTSGYYAYLNKQSTALTLSNRVLQRGDLDVWTARQTNKSWRGVAMSATGQEQTVVNYDGDGLIYTSHNYGVDWEGQSNGAHNWRSVAMSQNGDIQSVVGGWASQIYVSTNYGASWTGYGPVGITDWTDISMSQSGAIQTATPYSGQIYLSTDSGQTWAPKGSTKSWLAVAVSSDGQYQTAVERNGKIHVSANSGETWTAYDSLADKWWSEVAVSSNGHYQTAVENNGRIYVSTDYGVSWSACTDTIVNSDRYWTSIAMSADGQKQTALENNGSIYTSDDYGAHWATHESSRAWYSVAMSSDGSRRTASVSGGQIYTIVAEDTPVDVAIIASDTSSLASEAGIVTFGYGDGRTILDGSSLRFNIGGVEALQIANTGYVGIGTTSPDTTLKVVGSICASATDTACYGTAAGSIYAANFIVDGTTHLPDYVFEEDYPLLTIAELENYIAQNKHLPNVPSADEVIRNGLNLSQMVPILLEKTEENTLYIIDSYNQIQKQQTQIAGITDNQNKIVSQLTNQLADQTLSVNEKITLIGANLDELSTEQLETIRDQIAGHETRIVNLEAQMTDLKSKMYIERYDELWNFYLLFKPESLKDLVYAKNGNVTLLDGKITAKDIEALGTVKAKSIETDELELKEGKTAGKGVINSGETEEIILTPFASKAAKISITPSGDTFDKVLFYDELEEGKSFKVKIKEATAEGDINFDWFIIK